jgi:hypothetical protein
MQIFSMWRLAPALILFAAALSPETASAARPRATGQVLARTDSSEPSEYALVVSNRYKLLNGVTVHVKLISEWPGRLADLGGPAARRDGGASISGRRLWRERSRLAPPQVGSAHSPAMDSADHEDPSA